MYGSLGLLREGEGLLQRAQSLPAVPPLLSARQFAAIGRSADAAGQSGGCKGLTPARPGPAQNRRSSTTAALYVRIENYLGEVYWRQDNAHVGARSLR